MQEIETYIGTEYNMEPERPKFADYYEILGDDNDGGMGEVYFCKDKRSGQLYALKKAKAEAKYEDLFKKEAAFALELGKHPNIVYTTTIGHEGDMYYIVMELIGGQNTISPQGNTLVSEFNKSTNGIPVEQAYKWAIEFCEGMKYLTNKGMKAHKDIKPANIFITKDKTLKIGDFGLAETNPQKATGTPGYRAPEVKQGIFNEQTDIYSFGIVLYQLFNKGYSLTDATQYTKAGTEMLGKGEDSYPNAEEITSPYAQDIIRKCLQQDPQKRYQTFTELEGDLIQELQTLNPQYKFIPAKEEPLNAEEYLKKGYGWNLLNDNNKALLNYNASIKLTPMAVTYTNRGHIKKSVKDYEGALMDYTKAIETNPDYFYAYAARGTTKSDLHHFEDAVVDLDKAIELDPQYATAYNNRGNAQGCLEQYRKAIIDFDKCIQLDSTFVFAYNGRALAKYYLKDYAGALRDFDKAIELDHKYDVAYKNRGDVKFLLEDYVGAIKDYSIAIELGYKGIGAYYKRGLSKYQLKDYIGAIADYDKIVAIDATWAFTYNDRGVAKDYLKDYIGAMSDFNKTIELVSKNSDAYNNRGNVKLHLKDYIGAISDYDRAIELRPKGATAYNNRGNAKTALKDYVCAIADYDKAIDLDPQYTHAYYNRGIAKKNLKDYAGAIADYNKAIELDPKCTSAYNNLIALYGALNNPEKAEEIRKLKQKNCSKNK